MRNLPRQLPIRPHAARQPYQTANTLAALHTARNLNRDTIGMPACGVALKDSRAQNLFRLIREPRHIIRNIRCNPFLRARVCHVEPKRHTAARWTVDRGCRQSPALRIGSGFRGGVLVKRALGDVHCGNRAVNVVRFQRRDQCFHIHPVAKIRNASQERLAQFRR